MKYLRDDKNIKAFGKHLKALRKKFGMSQAQLAFECNLDVTQIARIERGEINTSIGHIFSISKALEIHPKELLDFQFSEK